jgi:hypothetical protein
MRRPVIGHARRIVVSVAVGTQHPVRISARVQRSLAPVQQLVVRLVLAYDEIALRVIRPILVDVVHLRASRQRLAEHSLGDK